MKLRVDRHSQNKLLLVFFYQGDGWLEATIIIV